MFRKKGFVHNFKWIERNKILTEVLSVIVLGFLIWDIATGFNYHNIHIVATTLLCFDLVLILFSYFFWRLYMKKKYKKYFKGKQLFGRSNWYGMLPGEERDDWHKANIEAVVKFGFSWFWVFGNFQIQTSFLTGEKQTSSELHDFYIIDFKTSIITYKYSNTGDNKKLKPHTGIAEFKLKEDELSYYNNPFTRISFGIYQETHPTEERWINEFEGNLIPKTK